MIGGVQIRQGRRVAQYETLFCSAGWQPAVSADWQSAERRILERAADCQSAIQQTASLRYLGSGSSAESRILIFRKKSNARW
jgi:hypothetical protein